jgi:hypothetical protein
MWSRASTSAQFAPAPKVISADDAVIPVSGLQLELPLVNIYAGVELG